MRNKRLGFRYIAGIILAFIFAFSFPCALHAADLGATADTGADSRTAALEEEFLFFTAEDVASIGSLHVKSVPESSGTITVITSKTISAMAARDLTDILKMVPGFDVNKNNFGEIAVSVNGVDNPANILVMLDGHRFNNFFTGSAQYDIPVDGIERIEIIRGPGSALYGTNAMVGVINIVSKKEEGLKVKVGAANFDTYKANFNYGRKGEEVVLHAFAEVYRSAGADGTVSMDRLAAWTTTTQYSMAPMREKDDKLRFFGHADLEWDGYTVNFNASAKNRGPDFAYHDVLSNRSRIDSNFLALDASRVFDIGEKAMVTPRAYVDRWSYDYRIQLYPNGYTDNRVLTGSTTVELFPNGEWMNKSYDLWTYGAGLKLEKEWPGGNVVTMDLSAEESAITNPLVTTNYSGEPDVGAIPQSSYSNWNNYNFPSRSRLVYAALVQDDWTPNRNLNATAGVRYDRYSDFGDTTNPRIALSFFPVEKVALKLQYATAFRAPTFRELYDQTDLQFYGNPNLKPERIETMEAGASYTYAANSYIRVSAFREILKDYITTLFNTTQAQATEYQNAGQLDVNGYSVEARHSYGEDGSSVIWNASLFNAKDVTSNSWLTRVPQFRANAGIIQVLPFKCNVTLFWMYSGPAMANEITNDQRLAGNQAQTGPFNLVNLAFTKRNIFYRYDLKLSAFNLLNVPYKELYTDSRYRFADVAHPDGPNTNLLPSNQRMFMLEIGRGF